MNNTKYETRELESWAQMKQIRRLHFHHIWDAADKGEPVVMGMTEAFLGYLAGLGDYADPSYGPYFTVLMRDPPELVKVLEIFEAKGHPREICSAMRCYLGQLYAGMSTRSPKGGTIQPNFMFQVTNCHTMAQTAQLFSEYLGIPYLSIDLPYQDSSEAHEYVVAQLHEGIEWMEKTIGLKYDDEKLIEATRNEWTCMQYWADIVTMCQAIPAPLDMRHLWSLRMPMLSMRHRKEAVEYTKALYDEVRWRVDNQISARGMERIRFLHEGFPPFHFIAILKQPNEYGAIFSLCENTQGHGVWEFLPDGTWKVGPTLEQRRLPLRNRDDALRAQAEIYLTRMMPSTWNPDRRPQEAVMRARDWHCEAAILGLDRGCHGYQVSLLETKRALQQAGIPVGGYEHSQADPRDFSLPQVLDGIEAFMESLGLSKLG